VRSSRAKTAQPQGFAGGWGLKSEPRAADPNRREVGSVSCSARVGEFTRLLVIGALAALSLPGVHAARAEADLVPPVSELFAWNSPVQAPPAAGPVSCAERSEEALHAKEGRHHAALARIAAHLKAQPGGDFEVLNGRGYRYPTGRDAARELRILELEAQRQRAARAGGG
jgi:hypothetical protein